MRSTRVVLLTCLTSALVGCAPAGPGPIAHSATGPGHTLPAALADPYLKVQVALAADEFEGVAAHARTIETAAVAMGTEAEVIGAGARKLGEAKYIEAARTAFGDVSIAIEDYAIKTKASFPDGVRVAYCPMADKPWLTKDKDIRNPYYGAAMLTCGAFK